MRFHDSLFPEEKNFAPMPVRAVASLVLLINSTRKNPRPPACNQCGHCGDRHLTPVGAREVKHHGMVVDPG
jgi:hypothetical protein